MRLAIIFSFLLSSAPLFSQVNEFTFPKWSVDFDFGSAVMVGRSGDIDQAFGFYTRLGGNYRIALNNKGSLLATGLGVEAVTYFTDGYFTIVSNKKILHKHLIITN